MLVNAAASPLVSVDTRVAASPCRDCQSADAVELRSPAASDAEPAACAPAGRAAAGGCEKLAMDMYDVKRGRKQAKLQVSQMGVSVFDKKGE